MTPSFMDDPSRPARRTSARPERAVSGDQVRLAALEETDAQREAFASFISHPFMAEVAAFAAVVIAEIDRKLEPSAEPLPRKTQKLLYQHRKHLEDISYGLFFRNALKCSLGRITARKRAELWSAALLDQADAGDGAAGPAQ